MTANELFFVTSRIVGRAGGYWVEVYVDGQRAPERDMGPFASVEAAEQAQKDFRDMLAAMSRAAVNRLLDKPSREEG